MAAREGSRPVFERYRKSLVTMHFPPAQQAQFYLQTAESYEALSQVDAALAAADHARSIAETYGFNQVLFAAEELAARVRSGARVARSAPEAPIPASLRGIATTIGEMRRLVPS
jgi:hypothetical protein